jgi:hypothetical protein
MEHQAPRMLSILVKAAQISREKGMKTDVESVFSEQRGWQEMCSYPIDSMKLIGRIRRCSRKTQKRPFSVLFGPIVVH